MAKTYGIHATVRQTVLPVGKGKAQNARLIYDPLEPEYEMPVTGKDGTQQIVPVSVVLLGKPFDVGVSWEGDIRQGLPNLDPVNVNAPAPGRREIKG